MELAKQLLAGNRRALARGITIAETGGAEARQLLGAIYRATGQAQIVGVTGAPGAGKSTLVNQMALAWRQRGKTVGIIAVDPSSPFTGGAILGDRIRMQPLGGDPGVFVRSMASRGRLGGLARASSDAVALMDAAGFQIVIVETVGAGQSEVEIASAAHTTIVIEVPGMGDDIQSIKAGILEIADLFVVNKADRDGAEATVRQLRAMLGMGHPRNEWEVPVLSAVASQNQGIEEIITVTEQHYAHLNNTGQLKQRELQRVEREFHAILAEMSLARIQAKLGIHSWEQILQQIVQRTRDPYETATELLQ